MYDTAVTFRTSTVTKNKAQKLFAELGMDMSTAMNIFLAQTVREERIPFAISKKTYNDATWEAIDEVYQHPEQTSGPYKTKEALLEALHA